MSEGPKRPASVRRASTRGMLTRVSVLIGVTLALIVASLLVVRATLPSLPGFAINSTTTGDIEPRTATLIVRDPATQQCRQVTFRNDTTELLEANRPCDDSRASDRTGTSTTAGRLGVLRKSFNNQ